MHNGLQVFACEQNNRRREESQFIFDDFDGLSSFSGSDVSHNRDSGGIWGI